MPTYKIRATYGMQCVTDIEAETEDAAIEKAGELFAAGSLDFETDGHDTEFEVIPDGWRNRAGP